jgi:hypothetical protein
MSKKYLGLPISSATLEEKYPGLPTPEGRMKNGSFQPIMSRFTERLTNGVNKLISHAAKYTLIKSVAQVLQTYAMSVFKMNQGFCDQYGSLIRKF